MNDVLPPLSVSSAYRYAAYFAPPVDSPWWRAGSRWLGRDAFTGELHSLPSLPGLITVDQSRLTAAPRRYGWHATLKAPFAIAADVDLQQLRKLLRVVCSDLAPFTLPSLEVTLLDDFLALVPKQQSADIDRVARACVTGLHALAAPLSVADLARRRAAGLTPEEDALLLRWGYPYVMDRFQFHMSLTGPLRETPMSTISVLKNAAREYFAPLPPCRFDSVALFAEPAPGADFVLLEHVPLRAPSVLPITA
jgi:putative phosphonate metabolism protein